MKKNMDSSSTILTDLPDDCIGEIIQFLKRFQTVNNFKLVKKEIYQVIRERNYIHQNILYKLYSAHIHENFNKENIHKISLHNFKIFRRKKKKSRKKKKKKKKIEDRQSRNILNELVNLKVIKFKGFIDTEIEKIFSTFSKKIINQLEVIDLKKTIRGYFKESKNVVETQFVFKNLKKFIIYNFQDNNNYEEYYVNCCNIELSKRLCKKIFKIKKLEINNCVFDYENLKNFTRLEELKLSSINIRNLEPLKYFSQEKKLPELNTNFYSFSYFLKNLVKLKLINFIVRNVDLLKFLPKLRELTIIQCKGIENGLLECEAAHGIKKLVLKSSNFFTCKIFDCLTDLEEFITNGSNPLIFNKDYFKFYQKLKTLQFCCSKKIFSYPDASKFNYLHIDKCNYNSKDFFNQCSSNHIYCKDCVTNNCKKFFFIKNSSVDICKKCKMEIGNTRFTIICKTCEDVFCRGCFISEFKKRNLDYNDFKCTHSKNSHGFNCIKCSRLLKNCRCCKFRINYKLGKFKNYEIDEKENQITKFCPKFDCNVCCEECSSVVCKVCCCYTTFCEASNCYTVLGVDDGIFCFKCTSKNRFIYNDYDIHISVNCASCEECGADFCDDCYVTYEIVEGGDVFIFCKPCFKPFRLESSQTKVNKKKINSYLKNKKRI